MTLDDVLQSLETPRRLGTVAVLRVLRSGAAAHLLACQASELSRFDLLRVRGIGRKALTTISHAYADLGLSFAPDKVAPVAEVEQQREAIRWRGCNWWVYKAIREGWAPPPDVCRDHAGALIPCRHTIAAAIEQAERALAAAEPTNEPSTAFFDQAARNARRVRADEAAGRPLSEHVAALRPVLEIERYRDDRSFVRLNGKELDCDVSNSAAGLAAAVAEALGARVVRRG